MHTNVTATAYATVAWERVFRALHNYELHGSCKLP